MEITDSYKDNEKVFQTLLKQERALFMKYIILKT